MRSSWRRRMISGFSRIDSTSVSRSRPKSGDSGSMQGDGLEQVERQRLVHREVVLQVHVDPQRGAVLRSRPELDDMPVDQRAEELPRALAVRFPGALRLVAVADQLPHRTAPVARPAEDVEQHAVRHLEARDQLLGRRPDQPLERAEIPVDEVVLGRPAPGDLLALAGRLLAQADVLDDVLGRLHDDEAAGVEALAARAPRDLVEVARAQVSGLPPVELAEPREQHGPDRHVDADAERVGPADDLQEAALGELFDQHAVLRQQPGVVQADAVLQPLPDLGSVGARELEVGDDSGERRLLLARADLQAREVLGAAGRVGLREVHHVDRGLAFLGELLEGARERDFGVGKFERHRPVARLHGSRRPAVERGQRLLEERGVAERGGHQQEPRAGKRQQGRLPGHATVAVGVPVKLVHHDVVDRRVRPFPEGDVGQDLGGAAQDGGVTVHRCVAGREPHLVGAELAAERHPLLVDQRLDRAGVNRALPPRERREEHGRGDERLARPCWRVQNDVLLVEEFEDRLLLRGIERQPSVGRVVQEAPEQRVARHVAIVGQKVAEVAGHRP